MKAASWFPFFKKSEEEHRPEPSRQEEAQALGPITNRRLDDLDALDAPFVRDPFFRLRPPYSAQAAELSLELAQMTYTLDVEPWVQAGWNDFSIQIDNDLQSGLTHGDSANGERMGNILNAWKLYRAKAALTEVNPVSQVLGAMRQKERSDTIKAVCMMHPTGNGRYILAIGFMGTGKRLYDWISNFRFTTEEGFHKGFYQLCTYFEEGAEKIVFPATAQALQLDKLTLGEVLSEMRSPNSRFHLWMAGHSQGGAVMQVFTHRLMTQWGVLPRNMVGYGFASPTVATDAFVYDPASYPLYHILNSDDMVPRMGALVHLGLCLNYPADDAFRQKAYDLSKLSADATIYRRLAPFRDAMDNVGSIFYYGAAFLRTLVEEKGEENFNQGMERFRSLPWLDKALSFAGDKAMSWAEAVLNQLHTGYQDIIGEPMEEKEIAHLCDMIRPIVREVPIRRLLGGIASYALPPHHIMVHQYQRKGPYAYIVTEGQEALQPFIWVKKRDGLPVRRYAERSETALNGGEAGLPVAKRRNAAPGRSRSMGVRRTGYSAARKEPVRRRG